jgi:hypothetical protein
MTFGLEIENKLTVMCDKWNLAVERMAYEMSYGFNYFSRLPRQGSGNI